MGLDANAPCGQRRRFVRVHECLAVELRESLLAKRLLATALDIGPGGMAVTADQECAVDTTCAADIFLPGVNEPIRVRARILAVRRCSDGQRWTARMRFEVFEGQAREALGRFLGSAVRRPHP